MRFVIEFPGSEISELARDGALVRLRLAVAAARNEAGERGWLTSVALAMTAASVEGGAASAFGRIARAELRHDTHVVIDLDVPSRLTGELELALGLANGTTFAIRGAALETSLAPDFHFREDFSC